MKVVLTDPARADLRAIANYIAKDNRPRSKSFVIEIAKRAQELGGFPERYPFVDGYADRGLRKRSYRGFLILYRIKNNSVRVIRIFHGSQDYSRVLGERGDLEGEN